MEILILTNRLPFPLNDGGNIATYKNIEYLSKTGCNVTLFSLNTNKHWANAIELTKICNTHAYDIDTGLTLGNLIKSNLQFNQFALLRFYDKWIEKQLTEIIETSNFEVIQLETPYMFVYKNAFKKFKGKVVLRAHNIEHLIWKRQAENEKNPLQKWLSNKYYKALESFEKEVSQSVDGIITISKDDEAYFKQLGFNKPITTIPAGIEMPENKDISPKSNHIGFIGSLQWMPNVLGVQWFVNNVWQQILKLKPETQFNLAGKNAVKSIRELKAENFTFHGMVKSSSEFILQNSIMVVPLLSGSGMRMKIIEAMANNRCVVSTSIGAEGIPLKIGVDAIIEDDPQRMAEAIVHLLNSTDKIDEIAANGNQFVLKNYDWNKLIKKFVDFYREL